MQQQKNMKIKFNQAETPEVVKKHILPLLKHATIFLLTGPLGAGKTALVKEVLRQSGVDDIVNSPTFTYVKTYHNQTNETFHHFDLYRISSADEFIATGLDEYLHAAHCYNFIEWPEVIKQLLNEQSLQSKVVPIALSYDPTDLNSRLIEL